MLRIVMALIVLLLPTAAGAHGCKNIDEKTSPATLLSCVKDARETTDAYVKALEVTRTIASSPIAVLEHIDFAQVRTADDTSKAARSIYRNLQMLLGPESYLSYTYDENWNKTTTEPFMILRSLYTSEAVFRSWFAEAESKILEVIARFAIQGALVTAGKRLEPILEKPVDALLAQKGMKWIFEHRCTDDEIRKPICDKSNFPAEFKAHYGTEATEENVWWLGWLNRRDLEYRGMSAKLQRLSVDFLKKIDKKS